MPDIKYRIVCLWTIRALIFLNSIICCTNIIINTILEHFTKILQTKETHYF